MSKKFLTPGKVKCAYKYECRSFSVDKCMSCRNNSALPQTHIRMNQFKSTQVSERRTTIMRKIFIHVLLCVLVVMLMTTCGYNAYTIQYWLMLVLAALVYVNAAAD